MGADDKSTCGCKPGTASTKRADFGFAACKPNSSQAALGRH